MIFKLAELVKGQRLSLVCSPKTQGFFSFQFRYFGTKISYYSPVAVPTLRVFSHSIRRNFLTILIAMQSYINMGKKPICELNTLLRFINAYLLISSRSKCPFITARKRRWAPTKVKIMEISDSKFGHLDPELCNICFSYFFFICFQFEPDIVRVSEP